VEGSNILRYDEGKEVSTQRPNFAHPDNAIARRFTENRLRLDVYRGDLRVGGRLLYFRPSSEDVYRDGLAEETRFDKRYIEASIYPFKLRAGDFSDVWGSGLAFSAYENRDVYFDSELDGVHAAFTSEPFFITGLRGTSRAGRAVEKAEVTAGRFGARMFGQSLAFNYVYVDSGAYPQSAFASVDWHVTQGILTLYGEREWNEAELAVRPRDGHATYVGSVLTKWRWSLLLEYKDYDYGVVTAFQNPATVYREVGPRVLQGREPHALNVPNEVGYQVEISGQLTNTTFVTGHYNLSSRHHLGQAGLPRPTLQEEDAPYWEMFASVDQSLPRDRRAFLEIGANEEASALWQERKWAWTRFSSPLRGGHEIEIEGEGLLVKDRTRQDREYFDGMVGVGWRTGGSFSFSAQYEWSDDRDLKQREGKNWPSVELATSLNSGKHRVIAFYGRERGGLRCSNGVCRQVQAFSGFRLTLETGL